MQSVKFHIYNLPHIATQCSINTSIMFLIHLTGWLTWNLQHELDKGSSFLCHSFIHSFIHSLLTVLLVCLPSPSFMCFPTNGVLVHIIFHWDKIISAFLCIVVCFFVKGNHQNCTCVTLKSCNYVKCHLLYFRF
jgi:hypothetical protein